MFCFCFGIRGEYEKNYEMHVDGGVARVAPFLSTILFPNMSFNLNWSECSIGVEG